MTFPDWHMEVVDLAAEGNDIVALCRVTGTHKGVYAVQLLGFCAATFMYAETSPRSSSILRGIRFGLLIERIRRLLAVAGGQNPKVRIFAHEAAEVPHHLTDGRRERLSANSGTSV